MPSFMVKNMKNCLIVDLDSSKEGFWCTEFNAKNVSSLQTIISEEKNKQILSTLKKINFWHFFYFFRTVDGRARLKGWIKIGRTLIIHHQVLCWNGLYLWKNKPAVQAAGQTLPVATPTLGKIDPFTKFAVIFDLMKQFRCS